MTINRPLSPQEVDTAVLSGRAAAHYLGIGLRTLQALTDAGRIPRIRLSPGRIGYLRSDLDTYIQAQRD